LKGKKLLFKPLFLYLHLIRLAGKLAIADLKRISLRMRVETFWANLHSMTRGREYGI